MYSKLRMMLIILSLAEIQLKGRAFLRLYEIERQRRSWCIHDNFGFSFDLADSWFDVYDYDPRIPETTADEKSYFLFPFRCLSIRYIRR